MATLDEVISYFTDPTATGYTPEKTLIFALIFVASVYVTYEMLKKFKIKVDYKLVLGIIPYILLAGALRVTQDAGVFSTWWLITPGMYFTAFTIILVALLLSILLERKFGIPYFKIFFIIGLLAFAVIVSLLQFVNSTGLILVSLFYLPWTIILYKVRWGIANKLVTMAQMFDATATYVAIQYFGYYEQHYVPSIFINIFSPVAFIFLKIAGIVAILFLIDRFKGDNEFNNYIKLMMGILGLATGTRDFLRLLALV